MSFKTQQEEFWAGNFGNEYIKRNTGDQWIASNVALFSKILQRTIGIESCIEFGSNIGLNLKAIKLIMPRIERYAVEINEDAVKELSSVIESDKIFHQSILDFKEDLKVDLSFAKCVLIHIAPEFLEKVYEKLYETSKRYIVVCEYYNPSPVTIVYRGHENRLFKRDFCGDLLKKYPDLQLLDYGFVYHKDKNFPQDDVTWFLLEKKQNS